MTEGSQKFRRNRSPLSFAGLPWR